MEGNTKKKHVLFLTWKDIRHPHAGGAEKVMHIYASALREQGYRVTWFASSFHGASESEIIDGIEIIRKYTNHTIWIFAWLWYKNFKKNNQIDVILDEAGGWPLLSPLYEKNIPIFFFAHHIGDREFDAFPTPIGNIARWVYRTLFYFYKKIPTIVVSNSTRDELVSDFGYDERSITVIENTADISPIDAIDFTKKNHDVIFWGRLTQIKRPNHAILTFIESKDKIPHDAKLHIIGNAQDHKYVATLKELVQKNKISDRVIFHGFISTEVCKNILTESFCLLVPSEKEGYGLVVIEANALGLPVIGYNVAGLRDSIKDGENGILVPNGNIKIMSEELVKLFANNDRYRILATRSLEHSKSISSWDTQVKKFIKTLFPSH